MFPKLVGVILIVILTIPFGSGMENKHNIVYAINAGGEAHTDSYGIHYARDPLMGKVGTASDYGRQLLVINRVRPNDEILYQTERYHHESFGYDLPLAGDGEYVLILKFCEVYFNEPNMKVFDVLLNRHTVISDFDIYSLVGRGTAHDEYVFFTVAHGLIYIEGDSSEIHESKVKLDFLKSSKDNPKINAIVLIKNYEDATLPRLAPLDDNNKANTPVKASDSESIDTRTPLPLSDPNDQVQDWSNDASFDALFSEPFEEAPKTSLKQRKTSGPRQPNPYSLDESSMMLPVFIAIGAFIPLLFCLCKL